MISFKINVKIAMTLIKDGKKKKEEK